MYQRVREAPREKRPSRRAMHNYAAFWTDEWFDRAAKLMRSAETACTGDERTLKRVRRYAEALEITRFRVGYFGMRAEWANAIKAYKEAKDKKQARPALEESRKKMNEWEARRKELYTKHVDTWILNACYLGFYRN
jgi:hypothetical protein